MGFVRRLIWDPWNVAHIARHQVTPEEVEEVCRGDFVVKTGYEARIMLIGLTRRGRALAIVLEGIDEGTYYVVTGRPADRKERRVYREEREIQVP